MVAGPPSAEFRWFLRHCSVAVPWVLVGNDLLDWYTNRLMRDLPTLTDDQVKRLCADLRHRIIDTVERTGGHLSSSLGAVELAVALHRVFDSAQDRILWDVGHQAYAHKLLTGREEAFDGLRQYGGLSGFPDPDESGHDAYVAGHAGNAVSAALGLALARDRSGLSHDVVAVIGDGSLTTGMSYEALNHAGHASTRLIIVINDNGMSISPTAGSLARRLHMLRTAPTYSALKRSADDVLFRLPLGGRVRWVLKKLKAAIKSMVTPVMLFEQLGITYLGPVDGHDVTSLERVLERARSLERPVVVHVVTRKGKGYKPAEEDPVRYHGVSPSSEREVPAETYSTVFGGALLYLLARDPRIVVVTAAMLDGTGLAGVADKFPSRVFDVGISEQHAVTLAGGLAAGGLRPVVAIYSTFLQRGFDQIVHDVCLPGLPVIFAVDRAGIVGEDGKTHQGIFDLGYLGLMPNMTVLAPRDGLHLSAMLEYAVRCKRPVALRYPRARVPKPIGSVCDADAYQPVAEMLRHGDDVLVIALGSMVAPALEAAEALSCRGIDVGVMDACVAHPLDSAAICAAAAQHRAVVTVEEHVLSGGFGSRVISALHDASLQHISVHRLGVPDKFVPHGARDALLVELGLDAEAIQRACVNAVSRAQAWPVV